MHSVTENSHASAVVLPIQLMSLRRTAASASVAELLREAAAAGRMLQRSVVQAQILALAPPPSLRARQPGGAGAAPPQPRLSTTTSSNWPRVTRQTRWAGGHCSAHPPLGTNPSQSPCTNHIKVCRAFYIDFTFVLFAPHEKQLRAAAGT